MSSFQALHIAARWVECQGGHSGDFPCGAGSKPTSIARRGQRHNCAKTIHYNTQRLTAISVGSHSRGCPLGAGLHIYIYIYTTQTCMSDNREIPHLRWRMQCVCKGFKPECPVQRLRPSRRKCPALLVFRQVPSLTWPPYRIAARVKSLGLGCQFTQHFIFVTPTSALTKWYIHIFS